jgi:hypothetical protein
VTKDVERKLVGFYQDGPIGGPAAVSSSIFCCGLFGARVLLAILLFGRDKRGTGGWTNLERQFALLPFFH